MLLLLIRGKLLALINSTPISQLITKEIRTKRKNCLLIFILYHSIHTQTDDVDEMA